MTAEPIQVIEFRVVDVMEGITTITITREAAQELLEFLHAALEATA